MHFVDRIPRLRDIVFFWKMSAKNTHIYSFHVKTGFEVYVIGVKESIEIVFKPKKTIFPDVSCQFVACIISNFGHFLSLTKNLTMFPALKAKSFYMILLGRRWS